MIRLSFAFDRVRNMISNVLGMNDLELTNDNHHQQQQQQQQQQQNNNTDNKPVNYIASKLLILLLIFNFIICILFPSLSNILSMVPGNTLIGQYSHIWTLFTAGYIEPDVITGVFNIFTFALIGPLLERNYTSKLFLRFVFIVNVLVFTCLFFSVIIWFAITEELADLYRNMSGFTGLNAALLVGLKQQYPERTVGPISTLKMKHLPFLFCSLSCLLWLLFNHIWSTQVPLVIYGTVCGYIYLRYFNVDPVTKQLGDNNNDFTFASLFPNVFHSHNIINNITSKLYFICNMLGCCFFQLPPPPQQIRNNYMVVHNYDDVDDNDNIPVTPYKNQQNNNNNVFSPLPSLTPQDAVAERRRAVAMKLIEDKLAQLKSDANNDDVDISLEEFNLETWEDTDVNNIV